MIDDVNAGREGVPNWRRYLHFLVDSLLAPSACLVSPTGDKANSGYRQTFQPSRRFRGKFVAAEFFHPEKGRREES
jgi:hypothetical protein